MLELLKMVNLGLAFFLEILVLVVYGYFGYQFLPDGTSQIIRYILAAGMIAIIAVPWGNYLAPRALHRLQMPWLLIVKLVIMILGILMLLLMHRTSFAIGLAIVVAIHYFLAVLWKQV